MKACILAIGSEMLTPFRVDTNSLFITERLNAIGYDVRLKAVVGDDVGELARLQSVVAEGLKRVEFGLRRKVEGDQNAIAQSGADESPEAYKKLNEDYFRSLGKGGK